MKLELLRAARHLRRRPVLAGVGILSLAVGIGCALASASVVNAVLFRAFPYPDADRLVLVWENNARRGVGLTPTSVLNFRDLRATSHSFEDLGAFGDKPYSLDGSEGAERVVGYQATAGLLEHTNVKPVLGRLFTEAEDTLGAPDVVVLSYGLWQRRFGGNPSIIGQTIRLTGTPYTVVGVMPREFLLPPVFNIRLVGIDIVVKEADLWIPFKLDSLPQRRDLRTLLVLGRLKPGHSIEGAQAEASTIGHRLATDFPVDDLGLDFTLVPLRKQVLSNVRALLALLLIVGTLVLVIAAINAAHLLLADSLTMAGETAVQKALGASSWRLTSNQGMVSMFWCGAAAIGAVIVAWAIQTPVAAYTRANVPRLSEVTFDSTVAIVALGLVLAMAIGVTAIPLLCARTIGTARSASSAPAPVGLSRWRAAFVMLQFAVAIIVVSIAALLYKSADSLSHVNPGFVADDVHVFEFMLPDARYGAPARRIEFQRRLLERMADVRAAHVSAAADYVPFAGGTAVINFTIQRAQRFDSAAKPRASMRSVSADYFDVLCIPVVDGRRFESRDDSDTAAVAIVNEAFVQRFMRGETVLGRAIKRGEPDSPHPWLTVVGVVGSIRSAGLGLDPQPEVYVPLARGGARTTVNLIVKATSPTAAVAPTIVDRVHRVDGALSPSTVATMSELIARATGQPFFYARVFGFLGGVACLLSLIGVYGITAIGIASRSTDLAIRACLGAQRSDVIGLVLRETGRAVALAAMPGALGALILQKRIAAFVYGLGSSDWTVIAVSIVVLSVLALATAFAAAWRVVDLRPLDLLKHGARTAA